MAAYLRLHIQLLRAAYRGACIITASVIVKFWEEVACRRHAGLVLPTAIPNVLSTHVLFDAYVLHLVLIL